MLQKIDHNLWVKDSYFKALGCKASTRMTIINSSKGLWVHSPVAITAAEIAEIKSIGEVFAIVAPNLFHHMHFAEFSSHFPQATCWAAQGLADKIANLPKHQILDDSKPIFIDSEISQLQMNGHKLNETLFFHTASSSLITADFIYNYQAEQYNAEKFLFWLLGCYGKAAVPFYHASSIVEKPKLLHNLNAISNLPIKRIIMSHGRIIEANDAAKIFAKAWHKHQPSL